MMVIDPIASSSHSQSLMYFINHVKALQGNFFLFTGIKSGCVQIKEIDEPNIEFNWHVNQCRTHKKERTHIRKKIPIKHYHMAMGLIALGMKGMTIVVYFWAYTWTRTCCG